MPSQGFPKLHPGQGGTGSHSQDRASSLPLIRPLVSQGPPLTLVGEAGTQKGRVCPGSCNLIRTASASFLCVLLWLGLSYLMICSVTQVLVYIYPVSAQGRQVGAGGTVC